MAGGILRRWQQRLWPIQPFELTKVIPLFLMKLFISLDYVILSSLKDTLIVTAPQGGAEVIPILKGWIVLPVVVGATLLYSKLSNLMRRGPLFYAILAFFMAFLVVYGFVLFPLRDSLCPHASSDWLIAKLGTAWTPWVAVYRYWMDALFFIIAELWSSLVIFLCFWGLSNEINRVDEAKRFYTLFIAGGNLAAMSAGPLIWYVTSNTVGMPFQATLQQLIYYAVASGLCVMALHWWMMRRVMSDVRLQGPEPGSNRYLKKTKLSLMQSLRMIVTNKRLLAIAVMVIGFGLTINLVEVTWKANLKLQYPNPNDYQAFMGSVVSMTGLISFILSLVVGGTMMRSLGWHVCAQITPIAIGLTGMLFFCSYMWQDAFAPLVGWLGLTPLLLVVILGAIQVIASKVTKYTFFDMTKEMVFIPLDQEARVKGKAAVDMVGSRLGKSGSSWVQVALFELLGAGSILMVTPYLIPIFAVMAVAWIASTYYLRDSVQDAPAPSTEPVQSGSTAEPAVTAAQ
jgi:ATP:ADP antiporter, AAA family